MSHKDPITGVMVADWWEIFTPEDMQQIYEDMETDRVNTENDLKTDKYGLYKMLREYGPDFDINIVKVLNIIDVKYSFTFRQSKTKIIAEVIAYDNYYRRTIHGKLEILEWDYSGSFYNPPDYGIEIGWLPHIGRVKVFVPKSILDDQHIKIKKIELKKPDDVIKLHETMENIFE